jgi:hypothetical protein
MKNKLHTWGSFPTTIIELASLAAYCKTWSCMCRRYTVERTSNHRVLVTYSNPDEWGVDHPISCYLPCYRDGDAWWVVLAPTSFIHVGEEWEYDPSQAFEFIWSAEAENPNSWLEPEELEAYK